jgi:N-acetylneuraminate synthase
MTNRLEFPDIIVELGINHNGLIGMAYEMLWSLHRVVDDYPGNIYAKTQKRTPRISVPKEMWNKIRPHPGTGEEMTYIEYKERMEFTVDEHYNLGLEALELGFAGYFASVWDNQSVDDMVAARTSLLKIPSAKMTNHDLIRKCNETGLPLIMSIGMSNLAEVIESVSYVDDLENLTLMVTTSTYPCSDEEIGLGRIRQLSDRFPSVQRIGFSSHSISPYPVIYSIVAGASIVEFHYTLDRALPGSDHSSSLELPAVELIVRELERIPKLFLHDELRPTVSEIKKIRELRG